MNMLKRQNNRHYTYKPFCLQHRWQFSQWRTCDITWKNHASESIIEEKKMPSNVKCAWVRMWKYRSHFYMANIQSHSDAVIVFRNIFPGYHDVKFIVTNIIFQRYKYYFSTKSNQKSRSHLFFQVFTQFQYNWFFYMRLIFCYLYAWVHVNVSIE